MTFGAMTLQAFASLAHWGAWLRRLVMLGEVGTLLRLRDCRLWRPVSCPRVSARGPILLQPLVREVEVSLPVRWTHSVLAAADPVAEPTGDERLVGRGHFLGFQAFDAE